jgi:hypothetical protein
MDLPFDLTLIPRLRARRLNRGKILLQTLGDTFQFRDATASGASQPVRELCWLRVVSVRQIWPLRTPNHASCSLPIPQRKSKIASIDSLIFTKG